MTTLFDAMVQTARELDALIERDATGGSTSSIIDTRLNTLGFNVNEYRGGSAFIIEKAGGAGGAPQGESRFVSAFVGSTGVITVDPVFSVAPAVGDIYGIVTNRYPRQLLMSKINAALKSLGGDVPTDDVTSLTTITNQREYALPVLAKRDLRQVWIATSLTAPWGWEPCYTCWVEHGAAGAVGNLIFPYQPPVGFKLKLIYMAAHPYRSTDAGLISDYVSLDWLALEAAIRCEKDRLKRKGGDNKSLVPSINDLMEREKAARSRRLNNIPNKFPVLPYSESYISPRTWS